MLLIDSGVDRYVAGEADVIYGNRDSVAGLQPRAVIWCHGSGETGPSAATNWRTQLRGLGLHATVHVGDLGLQTWGSDLVVTRIGQAITYLRNTYGADLPVALAGMSMGACSALNFAARFPEDVSCVAAMIPLTDLANARANTAIQSRWPEIDAIYGAPPNANYVGHSPILFAADMDPDLPIKMWYSTNDPLVPVSTVEAFVEARPQTETESMGAVGHNIARPMTQSLVRFVIPSLSAA